MHTHPSHLTGVALHAPQLATTRTGNVRFSAGRGGLSAKVRLTQSTLISYTQAGFAQWTLEAVL